MSEKPRILGKDWEDDLFASIQLSPLPMVITNPRLPDNPLQAVNEAFEKLTGYRSLELVGRNCRLLAGPGTEAEARAALRAAIAARRPTVVELLNYRRDGTPFRNAIMIAPVFDDTGKLAYFLGSQMAVDKTSATEVRRDGARQRIARLTPRQRDVLQHMAQGLRNKQIARQLSIDEKTVKMHRANLIAELDVESSAMAIRVAVEAGL